MDGPTISLTYIFKGMAIAFLVSFAVIALVMFVGFLIRECLRGLHVRRSARGQLLSGDGVRQEYSIKDAPAWDRRLEFAQRRALGKKLRELDR